LVNYCSAAAEKIDQCGNQSQGAGFLCQRGGLCVRKGYLRAKVTFLKGNGEESTNITQRKKYRLFPKKQYVLSVEKRLKNADKVVGIS